MIRLPEGLPALETLSAEGVQATVYRLQNWREWLKKPCTPVLLLNLMPMKAVTELDIARMMAHAGEDVMLLPVKIKGQTYKTTPMEHMQRFYVDIEDVMAAPVLPPSLRLIVTGAPVEQYAFEEVRYWEALCRIMDWAVKKHIHTLYICWGAQAALYHHYGIPKYALPEKRFGIFEQEVLDDDCPLLRGLSPSFPMPNSRHTEVRREDFHAPHLHIVAEGRESGVGVAYDATKHATYIVGHLEYEPHTLENEYRRDVGKGLPIHVPEYYYADNNPEGEILYQWAGAAQRFYKNWLSLCAEE